MTTDSNYYLFSNDKYNKEKLSCTNKASINLTQKKNNCITKTFLLAYRY